MSTRVQIQKLTSGVPGLDDALGGGFPEFSFNLIAGAPGSGKTTLAQQIMFANAKPEGTALYVTIVGEPPVKMLRYQQQYSFFDAEKIPGQVRFLHLAGAVFESGLQAVLDTLIREVELTKPKLVFVDSFRAIVRKSKEEGEIDLQSFVQRLSLHLTSLEATTFLIGEYEQQEAESNPIFSIADGIVWLSQVVQRSSVVRKIQVVKMRGQASIPGLHAMNISSSGLRVHPRVWAAAELKPGAPQLDEPRRSTGIAGLDQMLAGGIPAGYSMLVVGPAGSGKTTLATQFLCEGLRAGEKGLIVVFEKRPEGYLAAAPHGAELARYHQQGMLTVLHPGRLDLSLDQTMDEISAAVRASGAKRVVIDSLTSLELAIGPAFREDFHESLYRTVGSLVSFGVTTMMTGEIVESYSELRLSPHAISPLMDGIILQRYVEMDGQLRKVMTVVKLRGSQHSKDLRLYEIGDAGITVSGEAAPIGRILTGTPRDSVKE